jgi:hypothetical protein
VKDENQKVKEAVQILVEEHQAEESYTNQVLADKV